MAPTAAFLVLLALMSDPFCFHHNGAIWAPNAPLLTLLRPILVIAACSHFSYAGNTHNNHIIVSLRQISRNHVRFKPLPFHQNGIIWSLNAPLLTLRRPILVIAACSHISYAGNTHNNHKITSLCRTSCNHIRFKLHPKTTMPCWSGGATGYDDGDEGDGRRWRDDDDEGNDDGATMTTMTTMATARRAMV
jgi:hypothetical protein